MEEQINNQPEAEKTEKSRCLNCEKKLPEKALFCPRCGQRNNKGKVSMRELFQRFWNNFSHLDSKFVKICWQLFLPAHVTLEYFRGRQKRYPNPVQFFVIVMFFFLFFSNKTFNENNFSLGNNTGNYGVNYSVTADDSGKKKGVFKGDFFTQIERYVAAQEIKQHFDSLPPELKTPETKRALDSLMKRYGQNWSTMIEDMNSQLDSTGASPFQLDSLELSLFTQQVKISVIDLVRLEPDALADVYGLHDWKLRMALKQSIKSIKNPKDLVHAYLGSLTWSVLALITFMAGVLALFYVRQKRFYVEHFVFLIHQHSAGFLALAIALGINKLCDFSANVWLLIFFGVSLHLLFSMKNYYGQPMWKTFLKWAAYNLIYMFGFTVFFVIGLFVVFLIF